MDSFKKSVGSSQRRLNKKADRPCVKVFMLVWLQANVLPLKNPAAKVLNFNQV